MSVLGFHSEHLTPEAIALIQAARPAVAVVLDLSSDALAAIRPFVGLLVARFDPGGNTQDTYLGRGADLGHFILAGIAPVAHLIDAVTVLNEPSVGTVADAALVARTLVDAAAVLHSASIRCLGPNFSTGTPALPGDPGGPAILDALLPGVAACDFLGAHEYSKPSLRTGAGYLIGRTSKILDYYASKGVTKSAILTEVGLDFDLPGGQPSGYRANGVADAAYLVDLQWASGVWAADPRIRGAALFECGAFSQFASFDVTGTPLGGMLAAWLRSQNAAPTKGPTMPDYASAVWAPSPNYWPGRAGMAISAIVPHGTAGPGAVSWFANPQSQVSAHYVVEETGAISQCVAEADSAWHAGVVTPNSAYAGGPNPNLWAVGIEHTRDTANANPMPEAQIAASLALVADILRRRGPLALIPHDAIDVGRVCPGPGFPLDRFAALLAPVPAPAPTPPAQEVDEVIQITPAITAAARARLGALGGRLVPGGAIETELVARFALGQANPALGTQTPTPVVGSETGLPTGESYAALDSGEILGAKAPTWTPFNPEEKDRAAIIQACGWALR